MVLETIELDNYNRKYGEKNRRTENKGKHHLTVPQTENSSPTQTNAEEKTKEAVKSIQNTRKCPICGKPKWAMEHSFPARKAQCNNCKRTGHFAKVCQSRTVNRIQKEKETGSNTEPCPEVNHIQSANDIYRIGRRPVQKQSHNEGPDNKHPIEERCQTNTAERKTRANPFLKFNTKRARKTDRKRAP